MIEFAILKMSRKKEVNCLDKKRMGEIALALARLYIRKESITLDPKAVARKIGNISKQLMVFHKGPGLKGSISKEELCEFFGSLVREAVDNAF